MASELAVIIPTLNEGEHLGALLGQLKAQEDIQLDIIVVDGGSADETTRLAERL
ncbi:MAG: glycosyltransferase, partial [Pseudomonadales bacterium]